MRLPYFTLGDVVRWCIIAAVVLGFLYYIIWQSRIFIVGPVLLVHETPPATTSSTTITVAGTAKNIVWITLNDKPIVTTPAGEFKETVILENGYTIVQLEAADRFGRITTHLYPVVPTPPASTSTNNPVNSLSYGN